MLNKEFINYQQTVDLIRLGYKNQFIFNYGYVIKNFKQEYVNNLYNKEFNVGDLVDLEFINDINMDYVVLCITYRSAFKFIREKYNFGYNITYKEKMWYYTIISYIFKSNVVSINSSPLECYLNKLGCDTYEDAEYNCLNQLIDIAKEQIL